MEIARNAFIVVIMLPLILMILVGIVTPLLYTWGEQQ